MKDGAITPLIVAALTLCFAGCGADDATPPPAAYPLDTTLRLNQIQVLGSHNSYHIPLLSG